MKMYLKLKLDLKPDFKNLCKHGVSETSFSNNLRHYKVADFVQLIG